MQAKHQLIMEDVFSIKPFAVTARTMGHPAKLITPLIVANLQAGGCWKIVRTNAMWDTGAEFCMMSKRLAAELNVNFDKSITMQGIVDRKEAAVGFTYVTLFANGGIMEVITGVIDETSLSGEYNFIIGMDFINKGTLAISSTNISTTLSFVVPTQAEIDLTTGFHGATKSIRLMPYKESYSARSGTDAAELMQAVVELSVMECHDSPQSLEQLIKECDCD